ncbi:MAG: hypothetical protein Q7T17_03410 [Microbacterium sp.]|uniref:hypothetical protein n=1 Tax=Microbacterium sp. TaxID=51671 RepID=UPI00272362E9|nr:hypothetical protein [Microbacterium sp.]MDO8382012.1 hypothetical protein [Microbacterium sp.]
MAIVSNPLSASARAATTEEAAYRIDYPLAFARSTRVIAFDDSAAQTVASVAESTWGQAQFYTVSAAGDTLVTLSGESRAMIAEIEHSDSVIFVATDAIDPDAVASVGAACRERSIMTAGLLLLNEGPLSGATLAAIRPYARVLLVPADEDDLFELLKAIRA